MMPRIVVQKVVILVRYLPVSIKICTSGKGGFRYTFIQNTSTNALKPVMQSVVLLSKTLKEKMPKPKKRNRSFWDSVFAPLLPGHALWQLQ